MLVQQCRALLLEKIELGQTSAHRTSLQTFTVVMVCTVLGFNDDTITLLHQYSTLLSTWLE